MKGNVQDILYILYREAGKVLETARYLDRYS